MKNNLERWLDRHMHEVLRGAMVALPLRVLAAGLAFGLNILLARILGVQDTGIYFLALTITMIATTIANFGLGNVLVRYTAAGAAQDDWTKVQAVARQGTGFALLCAACLTILLGLSAGWLSEFVLSKPELTTPLRWMALCILPQSQLFLHAQLLRGLKKIAISQYLRHIDVPLLTMIFLVMLGGIYGVNGAIWSYLSASLITAMMALWFWKKTVRSYQGGHGTVTVTLRDILRSGFTLLQSNLMSILINSATTLMLGAMSTSAAVAIYSIAFRTAMLTRFALMAVNSIAGPKYAALHSKADTKALATTSRRSALLMTLAAGPLLLIFLIFPHWVMGLFGDKFVAGSTVLMILATAQFIAVFCGSVGNLLIMSGNEKQFRNINAISVTVALSLNLILIPQFSAIGAAISVAAAIIIRSLLGTLQVYRHLGILPFFVPTSQEVINET